MTFFHIRFTVTKTVDINGFVHGKIYFFINCFLERENFPLYKERDDWIVITTLQATFENYRTRILALEPGIFPVPPDLKMRSTNSRKIMSSEQNKLKTFMQKILLL